MVSHLGKFEKPTRTSKIRCADLLVPAAFFLVEVFAFLYLQPGEAWPLAFGALWAAALGALLHVLPGSRWIFALLFGGMLIYAVGQTGYYQLFSGMMWLSDFRYASEGSDYWDVILSYPVSWFLWIGLLTALGVLLVWKYPRPSGGPWSRGLALALAAAAVWGMVQLPPVIFARDKGIQYARSDYGRMQSAQAAYENMFNAHRLYGICGLHHMAAKDIGRNLLSLGTAQAREEQRETVDSWFERRQTPGTNEMTGILEGKNVILVLMESMDDWMLGDHTPTINRLMAEGINFTNFYTPPYGGIRTFNTEFAINTGSFLSSQGGFAFDYVTNGFGQSLASLLSAQGYSARTFHYNDPNFYSRGVFSQAMGYEEYVYYGDFLKHYTEKERTQLLYDENILFTEPDLWEEFTREGKTLNFLITRSAHLSYKYNEVLSHWALKRYPEYRGLTGHEETDCALLKARLVDDMFQWLLMRLEEEGTLEDTVIIGVTDHYTYGYKDEKELLKLSGVDRKLLLEKTPCFIWSPGLAAMEVDKTLNTADLLPTVLNLMGVESGYNYIGQDAFDEAYEGYALFSDGSWITNGIAYDASDGQIVSLTGLTPLVSEEFREKMAAAVEEFVAVNNLILDSDYYRE